MTVRRYFTGSLIVAALGLLLATVVGWLETKSPLRALEAGFIAAVLCVLEISISFDNAVVNARILQGMDEVWRRRFLTWGILIAVFGMRLVFPLVLVGVVAGVWPWEALMLAIRSPQDYATAMLSAHVQIAAFGGAFLFAVALRFFLDHEKDLHWVGWLERRLSSFGRLPFVELCVGMLTVTLVAWAQPPDKVWPAAIAGGLGLFTFAAIEFFSDRLNKMESAAANAARSGFALFLYLEILDASFSFDGVIGAFAITTDLFVIAIGLGVGAMFVRSLTLLLVEKHTLGKFRYLEHGAFYAIWALALSMFIDTVTHVPEIVPGGASAVILGLSYWSSKRYNESRAGALG